ATGASTWHQQVDDAVLATRAHGDLFVLRRTYDAKGSDQLERRSGSRVLWSAPVLINDFDVTDGHGLAVIGGYVLTGRASPKAHSQQVSSGVFDAVNGKERGTEDPTYRLAHVAAGVWGEVTAEETHLYIRGNYQPVTLPGGNTLLYYDDDSSSDLAPRYIGNQDERPAGTGVFDTATGRWLWRDPDLTSPVLRLDGALLGLSIRSPEEQQLLARDVESGRVLWSKEHTALRCPCLADEHSVIAFYGEMSKDDQGFIHVAEWDLVGLEARTGQLLWRVAPPKFSSSLLTGGEDIVTGSGLRRGVHRDRHRDGHAGLEIGSRQGEVRRIGLWATTTCRSSTSPHRAATVPVGPAAPAGPAGRVGPVTPAALAVPAGRVGPVTPAALAVPVAPVTPVCLVALMGPTGHMVAAPAMAAQAPRRHMRTGPRICGEAPLSGRAAPSCSSFSGSWSCPRRRQRWSRGDRWRTSPPLRCRPGSGTARARSAQR